MGRDHVALRRDSAATALDALMEGVTRLERVVEQFVGVPMPKIMKGDVDGLQHVPQERVQNSVVELIGGCASAPDLGANRGRASSCSTGVRAESHSGADRGCPCASDHGG